MTIVVKLHADSVAEGKQVRIQVVGAPGDEHEEHLIPDTNTEVTVSLYAGRRIVADEIDAPAKPVADHVPLEPDPQQQPQQ